MLLILVAKQQAHGGRRMEIHWVGMGRLEDAERAEIEARLKRLAESHSDLIDVRIAGRTTRHHHHGDQEIRITCQARGREIVAARTRPDLTLALVDALDVFEREVRQLREKRRDLSRAQPPEPPVSGIVDRIFREGGYGFILTDDGDEVYFHRNAVKEGLDFDQLEETDRVALDFERGREGLQATTVVTHLGRAG
jgi:cold shock CspA family protein/ribosome-associated translation inhibitor RaiA